VNRLIRTFDDLHALMSGPGPSAPAEALVVRRGGLVRILQHACWKLHEHRQRVAGMPVEREIVEQIKYWEDVLVWVKELGGGDLIFMNRVP